MNNDEIQKQLIRHEGLKLKPYKCTSGKLTIGVGRNLDDRGISKIEALMMLENDIDACVKDLITIFPEWESFTDNRQHALIDMRFMGYGSFRTFKRMIAAINAGDWTKAAIESGISKWADQVGRRAVIVANLMK